MSENEIAKTVVDAAFKVHTTLGPGLLESVYEAVMLFELQKRGLTVASQVKLPIQYESLPIENALRIDLLVDDKVVVELKAVDLVLPIHKKQLLTYLKLSGKKLGLMINFNEYFIKDGITRLIQGQLE